MICPVMSLSAGYRHTGGGRSQALAQLTLGLFVVAAAVFSRGRLPVVVAAAGVGLLAVAVLPRSGWRVLGGGLLAGAAVAVLCRGDPTNVGWFAVCVLAGWCAWRGGAGPAAVFTAVAVAYLVLEAARSGAGTGWTAWISGTVLIAVVCLMGHRQLGLIEALREAQAGLADRVRDEERARVARELHDVIGHSLTVSLLHLTSARLAVEEEPAEAARALGDAEDLARQSLTEIRHAVGLLREGPAAQQPLPGVDQLPTLVDGFRQAGVEVVYAVVGDPAALAATTGLTIYRILQESLTNAVRHSSGRSTGVRLEVGRRSVILTVDSHGAATAPAVGGGRGLDGGRGSDGGRGFEGGVGLASMRERAAAVGGECTAGPTPQGWRVRAVLPT